MTADGMYIWHTIGKSVWVSSILIIMSLPIQGRMAFHQSVPLNPDPVIYRKWLFSHDEDSNTTKIYTPSNFDYPLSFARPGMKFNKDGSFVLYEFAPNDQQIQIHGAWRPLSKGVLQLTFPDGERDNYQIEIKELKPRILKIRKL